MEEYQIWTLWSSNRIADGLNFVATVLLIWLAIRVAAATRASDETNLFGKLVSSAFGLTVLGGTFMQWTNAVTNWIVTARSLDALEDKSETAQGFIDFVGTTVPTNTPTTGAMILLAIVAIIILGNIWLPKK